MRFNLLVAVCLLFIQTAHSQYYNLPLNRNISYGYEKYLNQRDVLFHTSVKPYVVKEVEHFATLDSIYDFEKKEPKNFLNKAWNFIGYDHFIRLRKKDFELNIDPVFNFQFGRDLYDDNNVYTNTRGFRVNGSIGKNFSFESTFTENQSSFVTYLEDYIRENNVVPGQGRVRKFKTASADYANVTGYVSWQWNKFFNFQFGHDRHFFGDGYRSLLLSDNTYAYPFVKITTTVWKLKYTNLWTQFQIPDPSVKNFKGGYQRKYGSFHYLSWDATRWLQVGLFEGIIWQGTDSVDTRGFDVNYLNPIIFYRPVEFGLGSPDNATLGLNIRIMPWSGVVLYGQGFLDDFDKANSEDSSGFFRNKYGIQAGIKLYDPLGIKNLFLQAEYNQAQPYTYAHKDPTQNYTHYNQALAHPLGANFRELIGIVNYRYKRLITELKVNYAYYGDDTTGTHVGKDIFVSDFEIPGAFGNKIGQGLKTNVVNLNFTVGYLVNPRYNMRFEAGMNYRRLKNDFITEETRLFTLSFRADLFNQYYDF